LSGLHYQDRWRDQAQALIAGETVSKAAKRCDVAYTTAFRWRHRFLAALNLDKPQRLSGIVEVDETFILESFKGKRGKLSRSESASRQWSGDRITISAVRKVDSRLCDRRSPTMRCGQNSGRLGNCARRLLSYSDFVAAPRKSGQGSGWEWCGKWRMRPWIGVIGRKA
jgi:Homeodomain-like domain